MPSDFMPQPDVVIAGAGIIGLSLALELERRGASVAVVDPQAVYRQASFAAAGMLAAYDPHNPPELLPLSELSLRLYPEFLARLETPSGISVPFQTDRTWQHASNGPPRRLHEYSIDPRQLGEALSAAVQASSIHLREHAGRIEIKESNAGLQVCTAAGVAVRPKTVIHANGAWFQDQHVIAPRKGQMLRVHIPATLSLREVHRAEGVYVVPRLLGPQAGTAIIGATVEDAGFDTAVSREDLSQLRKLAAELVPALADEAASPQVEAWAGLRPVTLDSLPLLGLHHPGSAQWVATGHFRNGILLAPATAVVMADLLEGKPPAVDLLAFSPGRFARR